MIIITFFLPFVLMTVGSLVAAIVVPEGVLLLKLIVVSCLLVVAVEVLVALLASTLLLPGVAYLTITLVLVRFVVILRLKH